MTAERPIKSHLLWSQRFHRGFRFTSGNDQLAAWWAAPHARLQLFLSFLRYCERERERAGASIMSHGIAFPHMLCCYTMILCCYLRLIHFVTQERWYVQGKLLHHICCTPCIQPRMPPHTSAKDLIFQHSVQLHPFGYPQHANLAASVSLSICCLCSVGPSVASSCIPYVQIVV